jgi:hypothetical protein
MKTISVLHDSPPINKKKSIDIAMFLVENLLDCILQCMQCLGENNALKVVIMVA